MNTDCIYFEETYAECHNMRHCTYRRSLFKKGEEDETMCRFCRLWDAYIPQNATKDEKENAIKWQNMPYDEQPDYDKYFK